MGEPTGFAPEIQTRSEKPMSATVGVYEDDVAPAIGTQLGRSPTGLQRRHEYVNASGVDPDQVPAPTVSGVSTTLVLAGEIGGVAVFFGAIAPTAPVTSEFCVRLPSLFVALTATRIRNLKSLNVGTKELDVAPAMSKHDPFTGSAASHRFHW